MNNVARSGKYSPGAAFVELTTVRSFDMRFDGCWGSNDGYWIV